MNSVPGAADDSLLEEMRTGNLERECNEESCDWAEAYEIFGDKTQTDDFMYNRLHLCEIKNPCFNLGTASCQNKWDSYWCQCLSGWYGKDCDFMDTKGGHHNHDKIMQVFKINRSIVYRFEKKYLACCNFMPLNILDYKLKTYP